MTPDHDNLLDVLAERARDARPPLVDVRPLVMKRLQRQPRPNWLLWAFAGASSAAAAFVAALAAWLVAQQAEAGIDFMPPMIASLT
jgi:hypothetical protein